MLVAVAVAAALDARCPSPLGADRRARGDVARRSSAPGSSTSRSRTGARSPSIALPRRDRSSIAGRPGFYLGLHALHSLEHPVTPLARNELVPHLYADWWGDWALTWDSPPPPAPAALLPPTVVAERARQSVIGLVPSLLALAGILALGLLAFARRSAALAVLPLTALAVVAAYVLFAVRYPSTDGDTIKGTYLLMVLPAGALGAAFVVDVLRPAGRTWTLVVAAALAAAVAVELPFLVL